MSESINTTFHSTPLNTMDLSENLRMRPWEDDVTTQHSGMHGDL